MECFVGGQAWENVIATRSTPDSVKKLLREHRGLGVTFLIPSKSQRPWSPPVGFQCVYETYFQDDTKLWFPIPRLVTSYVRRRGGSDMPVPEWLVAYCGCLDGYGR